MYQDTDARVFQDTQDETLSMDGDETLSKDEDERLSIDQDKRLSIDVCIDESRHRYKSPSRQMQECFKTHKTRES